MSPMNAGGRDAEEAAASFNTRWNKNHPLIKKVWCRLAADGESDIRLHDQRTFFYHVDTSVHILTQRLRALLAVLTTSHCRQESLNSDRQTNRQTDRRVFRLCSSVKHLHPHCWCYINRSHDKLSWVTSLTCTQLLSLLFIFFNFSCIRYMLLTV